MSPSLSPNKKTKLPRPIAGEITDFLARTRLKKVYVATGKNPPPQLAFLVHFPRLSVTLAGCDEMEMEMAGKRCVISPRHGEAVFVPPNCWNKPTWKRPVKVLHLLFGKTQVGISLVKHDGRFSEPISALKTSTHRLIGGRIEGILNALLHPHAETISPPIDCLLVEALLHSCLNLLHTPALKPGRKGRNTYERVCLYIQENFHKALTRDAVAAQFRLNPNHLSRLFRREGLMKFTDYLTWVRIDRAKFMLKSHEMMQDQVAASCGFSETSYFCRVFKKKTKLTPSQYRQEYMSKN